ncbi:hypothetical protein AB9128_26165 [Streptomyces cinereoruber]|uniref:hypothetical protein n=1 Tax=Streptomyces cinereoruber TaxID=67260 RepID=UPI003EBD0886
MRTRRFALVYGLLLFLLCCVVGYELNASRPSVPWAVGGAVAAAVLVVAVRRGTAPGT